MTRVPALVSTAAMILAAGLLIGAAPNVGREGDAEQRAKLAEMEAKAFPADTLATLEGWVGGEPFTASSLGAGDVIAFAFVDVTNPAAMTTLNTLARLARTHAEKGLAVFAVHPEAGFEEIERLAGEGRIRVPVAKDTAGAFRTAMHADDTPDLYIIDRAGQLRYADIETRSLTVAVFALLKESGEEALANAAAESAAVATGTEGATTRSSARTTEKPGKPKAATPADYLAAAWPAFNTGSLNASDVQGQALPVPLGSETWLTQQQDLAGKVIVLDFWATWCGPCISVMPRLDELQSQNPDTLLVLGVAGQARQGYPEDAAAIRSFMNKHKHSYGQLIDPQQRVYRGLKVRAIPHVVVLSSDGVVRWQGNPHEPTFRAAVDQIIRVDPGL